MLIVLGAYIGGIIVSSFKLAEEEPIQFTSSLFFNYLLPPIVLESGYFMNKGLFFKNLASILTYAFFVTIFSAFVLGGLVYAFGQANWLNVPWSAPAALLFGVITSAVDPVAVLAVFEEIHVDKVLHILVFGESLLNDAVTVVLFQLLSIFANKEVVGDSITGVDVVIGIVQFIVVIIVSLLIGVVFGLLAAFITKYSEPVHVLEPIIVFAMGYLAYLLADAFALSGIITLIFCAMIMRHYMEPNFSRKSVTTIKYTLKMLSNVAEAVIFLFLGISLYTSLSADPLLIFITILFSIILRPIAIVVLSFLLNLARSKKIGWREQLIMSYSGLRGAVAVSLALLRLSELTEGNKTEQIEAEYPTEKTLRQQQLAALLGLTIFTVFVQGTTIKPLVRLIHVRLAQKKKETLNECVHSAAMDHIASGIEDIIGRFGRHNLRERLIEFDVKYVRRVLERYPDSADHHILKTFKRLQYKDSENVVEQDYVIELDGDTPGASTKDGKVAYVRARETPVEEEKDISRNASIVSEMEMSAVPSLMEVVNLSYAHPHADHFRTKLSFAERDNACDHRFEPVRHHRTKVQKKLKKKPKNPRTRSLYSMFQRTDANPEEVIPEEPILTRHSPVTARENPIRESLSPLFEEAVITVNSPTSSMELVKKETFV
jgi:sodium/hydrogen exchanger 3